MQTSKLAAHGHHLPLAEHLRPCRYDADGDFEEEMAEVALLSAGMLCLPPFVCRFAM